MASRAGKAAEECRVETTLGCGPWLQRPVQRMTSMRERGRCKSLRAPQSLTRVRPEPSKEAEKSLKSTS